MKYLVAVALVAMLVSTAAQAQHKHDHGHDAKGPNGGALVSIGDYHLELIAKDGIVDVHVMDHDNKPKPVDGYKGLAILSAGGKSLRIVLQPADASRLSGKAEAALPAQPKGVVQITPPNGKTVQAKFD